MRSIVAVGDDPRSVARCHTHRSVAKVESGASIRMVTGSSHLSAAVLSLRKNERSRNERVSLLLYSMRASSLHPRGLVWHRAVSTAFAQPDTNKTTATAVAKYAVIRPVINCYC